MLRFNTPGTEDRLTRYLAAAGAAAVGSTAHAALQTQVLNTTIVDGDVVSIDLNNDSVDDFTFTHTTLGFLGYDNQALYITADSAGSEVALFFTGGTTFGWVSALADDDNVIDAADGFYPTSAVGYGLAYLGFTNDTGTLFSSEFFDVTDAYLGLKIEIAGQTHYGWALMDVGPVVLSPDTSPSFAAVIKEIAYEDVPNTPAAAPEPTSLSLLALGAIGVSALRRR